MFEVKGNLWTLPADVICITTNGFVKNNGEAVMGRGCAKEATERIPGIQRTLGEKIKEGGNHVHTLEIYRNKIIVSFPVKHNWWEEADLELIERSCDELVLWVRTAGIINFIAIPRPGCGNGKLEWKDVRPICEEYFDDRFGVVTFG